MEVYVSPKNSWNGKSYKIHYTDDDNFTSFHMNIQGMFYICKAELNLVNQFIIDITKKRLINKKCYWFVILFTFYFNFYRSIIQV